MSRSLKCIVMILVVALALGACKKKQDEAPAAPPTPAADVAAEPTREPPAADVAAEAAAPADAAPAEAAAEAAPEVELTWDEKVALSKAITPTVEPQTLGDKQITADVCTFEGLEILGKSTMDIIQAIAVTSDGKLYMVDADGQLLRFAFKEGDACVLVHDAAFGEGGKLKLEDEIDTLNVDDNNKLYASSSWNAWRLTEATADYACKPDPAGYIVPSPDGKWGLNFWSRADLAKIEFTDTGCTGAKWEFENPISMVHAVAFMGDLILIGGNVKANPDDRGNELVLAFDKDGKEQFRVGSTADSIEDSTHCWVHGVSACASGICVLDSNCRKMVVWTDKGEFTGQVKLTTLFGLDYPWYGDFQVVGDVTYVAAGDTRNLAADENKNSDVAQGFIFRVHGL